MGNITSSVTLSSPLTPTSQLAGSISPSTMIMASPSALVSMARTADGGLPSCGSSGSPCCVSLECSSTDDTRYESPAATSSSSSPECTDEPSTETTSVGATFTCVDWGCISSVVQASGSSLCATADLPWTVTSTTTSTVYYYTDDCSSEYPEWTTTTSWHLLSSSYPPVVTTTVSIGNTLTTSSGSPWPATTGESCSSEEYDDPWGTCLSTPSSISLTRHRSMMTLYTSSSSPSRHHRHHHSTSTSSSTRSHSFFTARTPGTCHPPNCNGPPTDSGVWPQTTMPTASGTVVTQRGGGGAGISDA